MYIYKGYEIPETFLELGLGYHYAHRSPFMVVHHESGKLYKRLEFYPFTLDILMTGNINFKNLIDMVKYVIDKTTESSSTTIENVISE